MQKLSDPKANADKPAQRIVGGTAAASPVSESDAMREVNQMVERLAGLRCHVLIIGETGTGKARLAQKLHQKGPQADSPLVTINCAAMERAPFEAAWRRAFGFDAPASPEAEQAGARPGTVLLGHVDELPTDSQALLLRLLDELEALLKAPERDAERTAESHGGALPRLICTASEALDPLVAQHRFRPDLVYRLRVATIQLVPLRQRRDDIVALAQHFVAEQAARLNPEVTAIAPATLQALAVYSWPGNVRELRNVIEHALIGCDGGELQPRHLPVEIRPGGPRVNSGASPMLSSAPSPPGGEENHHRHGEVPAEVTVPSPVGNTGQNPSNAAHDGPLPGDLKTAVRDFERLLIVRAIRECGGNRDDAARRLNISKATLYRKLDGYRPEV